MKRGVIWITLPLLLVASLVLTSCNSSTTTATTTKITTQPPTPSTTIASTASKTTSTTAPSSTTSTASTGANWWDSLGKPQYGGVMILRSNTNVANWDPYNSDGLYTIELLMPVQPHLLRILIIGHMTNATRKINSPTLIL